MGEIWREVRSAMSARQQVPDPMRSLRLAIELGISGYEAQYLSLAEQLEIPLVTEEGRLIELSSGRALSIGDALQSKLAAER